MSQTLASKGAAPIMVQNAAKAVAECVASHIETTLATVDPDDRDHAKIIYNELVSMPGSTPGLTIYTRPQTDIESFLVASLRRGGRLSEALSDADKGSEQADVDAALYELSRNLCNWGPIRNQAGQRFHPSLCDWSHQYYVNGLNKAGREWKEAHESKGTASTTPVEAGTSSLGSTARREQNERTETATQPSMPTSTTPSADEDSIKEARIKQRAARAAAECSVTLTLMETLKQFPGYKSRPDLSAMVFESVPHYLGQLESAECLASTVDGDAAMELPKRSAWARLLL